MLNVMAALPNIGGALCSTPQSLAHAHYFNFNFNFNDVDLRAPKKLTYS